METIELTMTIPDGVENDPEFQERLEEFIRDWEEDGIWWEQLDGWVCPECDDHWTHFWGFHKWLGQYYGQPCRLIATSRMNTALIEFPDGKKHVTLRYGLRKLSWTPKK